MLLNSQLEKELEYRRVLFKAAASGDARAQQELEREYHVRIRCKPEQTANRQRNHEKR